MAVIQYLQAADAGGNPIYITDITTIASQMELLAGALARQNSYDPITKSTINGIAILSGFVPVGYNVVSPGYVYFNGDVFGFQSSENLTLGGYLVATKTQTTSRTTKEGTEYMAYVTCELSVSQTSPEDPSTLVGEFTQQNIIKWKTSSTTSARMIIADGTVDTDQIADKAVTSEKLDTTITNAITNAVPTFSQNSFLDGTLQIFQETRNGIWHLFYKDDTTDTTTSGSTILGTISEGIVRSFASFLSNNGFVDTNQPYYETPLFATPTGGTCRLRLTPSVSEGTIQVILFVDAGTGERPTGVKLHDTIIGV